MAFRVLRVGSHPTTALPGAGRAGAVLAADPRYRTCYRAPAWRQDPDPVAAPEPAAGTYVRFLPFRGGPVRARRRPTPALATALLHRLLCIRRFCREVLREAEQRPPDLVHVHSPMYAPVLRWARRRGIPTVMTFHGSEVRLLARSRVLRRACCHADLILCVAAAAADEVRRLFPRAEVGVASNGVDLGLYRPAAGERRAEVLAVGSLRWHKDHATLLRAFAAAAGPEWRLRIRGEGELREELTALAEELGLAGRVELPGMASAEQLREELGRAAVFAMSSVTEGLPKALLEAMASGCACVATDVGDCRAALADPARVVPPGEPQEMAAALAPLLAESERRRAAGEADRERARAYSWDAYRDRHYDLYARLLGRGGAPTSP